LCTSRGLAGRVVVISRDLSRTAAPTVGLFGWSARAIPVTTHRRRPCSRTCAKPHPDVAPDALCGGPERVRAS